MTAYIDTLANTVELQESSVGSAIWTLVDHLVTEDEEFNLLVTQILDAISANQELVSMWDANITSKETLTTEDWLQVALVASLIETIDITGNLDGAIFLAARVLEALTLEGAALTTAQLHYTVTTTLVLVDIITRFNLAEVVTEGLLSSDDLSALISQYSAIVDTLQLSESSQNSMGIYIISTDGLLVADLPASKADLIELLSDGTSFVVTFEHAGNVYQGLVMNPETYAVSEYDNYSFNSTAHFEDRYLLASEEGLYTMEGSLDDGAYITSKIKTASIDFGTSSLKQCPKVYLGIDNEAALTLSVSVDGSASVYYHLDVDSQSLSTQMFDIGKGLKGRYWQFGLQTKGSSQLHLDELELFPIQLGRKRH